MLTTSLHTFHTLICAYAFLVNETFCFVIGSGGSIFKERNRFTFSVFATFCHIRKEKEEVPATISQVCAAADGEEFVI